MIYEAIYHFSDQCRSGCNMYQIALLLIEPGTGLKEEDVLLSYSDDFRYKNVIRLWALGKHSAPLPPHAKRLLWSSPGQRVKKIFVKSWARSLSKELWLTKILSLTIPSLAYQASFFCYSFSCFSLPPSLPPSLLGLVSRSRNFKTQDWLMQYIFWKYIFSEEICSCRRDMRPWR